MEGARNGENGNILFCVVLDEEVNNVAFSIDHVWGCRSVSLSCLGWTGGGNTYDQRDCRKGKCL